MPFPYAGAIVAKGAVKAFFAAHGGAIAASLGAALLFGSKRKGRRRHQQIHQAQDTSLGTFRSPHGPIPVLRVVAGDRRAP